MRPVLVFQNDAVSRFTTTVVTIPFTTNLRRASLLSCVLVQSGEGGLSADSVLLCYQLRVLDTSRLTRKLGTLSPDTMAQVETAVLHTLGFTP